MPLHRKAERWIILGFLSIGALPGALSGYFLPGLIVSLSGYLAWQLYNLRRFTSLLNQRKRLSPPHPQGLWHRLYSETAALQNRARKRKRSLVRFSSRFKNAASALPDAAFIIGKNLGIEWTNPAAKRLLGIEWPKMADQSLLDLVDHPLLKEYLQRADYSQPLEFSPPLDKSSVISMRITPFGKKRQLLVVARDITQLYHLSQTRRDFVSNVSHELRTPLTVITGFVETLLFSSDQLPPQQARALKLVHQQAQRMEVIISDLLTLSRLEMDEDKPIQETVRIPQLLESIVAEALTLSGSQQHSFKLDVDASLWMSGNRKEFYSLFSNLIFNAVRHTPEKTRIGIHWRPILGLLEFSVTDTGEGIPSQHIPRLTERFYRVDTSRSRDSGGTGLGLAIVKHILNRHGGNLLITSETGKGSTFTCLFPGERAIYQKNSISPKPMELE